MPESQNEFEGTRLLPVQRLPQPRRTSPGNSVSLGNRRTSRDASLRASAGSDSTDQINNNIAIQSKSSSSARRNSSGESHDTGNTGQSDPKKWFDQSNKNPTATFDSHAMDIDPPFFQKESDSSNEDKAYLHRHPHAPKRTVTQSSSADEYRSVIDDLTVEIQKLKDELRRYKQKGPDMLRKDKLFEIKCHGLPKRKKRELESALRDFASSLADTPETSSRRDKHSSLSSRHSYRNRIHSGSRSMSKNAPSSSGSNTRPVDSAYASMSIGAHSSGTSMGRPSLSSNARSSEQKVESYLRDIPEALYPRHVSMTDKDKRKYVVRRLEQLFTGKLSGVHVKKDKHNIGGSGSGSYSNTNKNITTPFQSHSTAGSVPTAPAIVDTSSVPPPTSIANEPSREARILPPETRSGGKKSRSRDNVSSSRSGGDQTESGNGSSGANPSPTMPPPPEQRATRLKDLDPDRVQVPSENIEYIKHLGLVPPELLAEPTADVHPDADGWVYLNLLCNLAQLHMINVTPDFVRAAVSDISAKFQLSPDGRKIRWRGGTEGTKFSSDNSSETSHNSMDIDTDGSPKGVWRKRQKTGHSTGDEIQSGSSSNKNPSKLGQTSLSSESFHYKPIFVRQDSLNGHSSMDETLSSFGPVEESNVEDSRMGSATSLKRKRRYDGAIIYYSGAPFCTDLSGDPNDVSPSLTNSQSPPGQFARPMAIRSESGSNLGYRPLSDDKISFPDSLVEVGVDSDDTPPGLTADTSDESSEIDLNLEWSDDQQFLKVHTLEPCGLGGVLPEDHFMVVVTTKRAKDEKWRSRIGSRSQDADTEMTDTIVSRLASMSTSSQGPVASLSTESRPSMIEIEYVSGRIKRLTPVRLPPPAIFFPPFSSESSFDSDEVSEDPLDEDSISEGVGRRRARLVHSDDYPDGVDLTSGDEDGEDPDDEADVRNMYATEDDTQSKKMPILRRQSSAEAAAGTSARGRSKSDSGDAPDRVSGSSVATAGGRGSSLEDSDEMSS